MEPTGYRVWLGLRVPLVQQELKETLDQQVRRELKASQELMVSMAPMGWTAFQVCLGCKVPLDQQVHRVLSVPLVLRVTMVRMALMVCLEQ